ncbi:Glycosyl hydrolase family 66 [Peptoclostridium litorale DSM 5388]|uniref:Glycoside-hydrolase family GH114 TIM-barrel domain-containing protein n=1 Tax=Peptoclostridium litorale DSM 5388 TaxID=1121324 RepID=A0A069RHQ7_PEPLI|nr:glycoside hydrolase family 66 protein [Peptoclostridium litorale]KDR93802.1 hypothetical protein CLIT_23c00740 [Peptoclostridium litorale DSM 5388]SIN86129.1 Glycosyl hydrolase family 66 [Peptoclostridium litorale DSM 5388]
MLSFQVGVAATVVVIAVCFVGAHVNFKDSWAMQSRAPGGQKSGYALEEQKDDYVIYYGDDSSDAVQKLSEYDTVVIEPKNFSRENVLKLQKSGSRVLGYLSIVEQNGDDVDFISLKDGWFFMPEGEQIKNEAWNSYYMDIREKGYQNFLLRQIYAHVVSKGLDGIMIDTVGDIDDSHWSDGVKSGMKDSYRDFLMRIRKNYSKLYIIQNWGFKTIYTHSGAMVDGVMWEGLSDGIIESDQWSRDWLEKLGDMGLDIYAVVPSGGTFGNHGNKNSNVFIYKRDGDVYDSVN